MINVKSAQGEDLLDLDQNAPYSTFKPFFKGTIIEHNNKICSLYYPSEDEPINKNGVYWLQRNIKQAFFKGDKKVPSNFDISSCSLYYTFTPPISENDIEQTFCFRWGNKEEDILKYIVSYDKTIKYATDNNLFEKDGNVSPYFFVDAWYLNGKKISTEWKSFTHKMYLVTIVKEVTK